MIRHPSPATTVASNLAGTPTRFSRPRGEIALCNLPPYSTQPWLSMGLVLHMGLLEAAGLHVRLIRPLDPPFDVPSGVLDASLHTFIRDPSIESRLEAMEREYARMPSFFERLVDDLLAGGERVVGLSLFRNNADVSIQVARVLKRRSPETFVILGGPEAIEEPEALRLPWVDAVVGRDAESVLVPLVESVLRGHPERAALLPGVWLAPRFGVDRAAARTPVDRLAYPTIDYGAIVPLLAGDPQATVPLLLNWGCPYRCAFCSNKSVYSRFEQGSVGRVLDEMDLVMSTWASLHRGTPPGVSLQLSDATTNAIPEQFDSLLRGIAERVPNWATRPSVRGQSLFDRRITEDRVRLMERGCFTSTFFGLETGSDRLRRALQKPGTVAQVASAIEAYHRAGGRGLHFGVPVGIPGETDEDFAQTERFFEWALTKKESIESLTVLPYVYFLTPQDPSLGGVNRGERRGVLWRSDAPGGDPEVRARRFMRLFDLVDGRVPVNSPVPPATALPAMLPNDDVTHIARWIDRHGGIFDQLTPSDRGVVHRLEPWFAEACERVRVGFERNEPAAPWKLAHIAWHGASDTRGLAVVFTRSDRDVRFGFLVTPRDDRSPAYLRSPRFNVSYLNQLNGAPCVFDRELMAWCVATLGDADRPTVNAGPRPGD